MEHLDKILGCSTGFPNTYVSLPRTTPSVVSLMTGRLPYEHGIRTMFPSSAERQLKRDSLPILLAENGYKTAVVSDYAGEMFHDVALGFDIVKAPSFNFPAIFRQRSLESQYLLLVWLNNALGRRLLPELVLLPQNANPEVLTDQALEMISSLPQPFFTTVFYSATHFPYTANYPDYSYFSNKSYRGAFRFSAPYVLDAKHLPGPEEQAQVSALYDGALLGVDRALGRLVDNFRQSGLLNNTIIVVTGDHGENLYEQGSGLGHGDHFVAGLQSLRTPTVVSVPGCQEKGLVQKDVRSIDLPRTIAGLLGYSEDADQRFGGRSFYAEDPVPRPVYAETGLWMSSVSTSPIAQQRIDYPDILQTAEIDFEFGDEVVLKQKYQNLVNISKHRLYKEGPWVLLYKPTRSGVRYELYDYGNDPHLTRDLSQDNTERTDRMRTRLLALMAAEPGVAIKNDFVVYENL